MKKYTNFLDVTVLLASLLVAGAVIGCGGDDDDDSAAGSKASGGGSQNTGTGTGGTSTSTGTGTGGTTAPAAVCTTTTECGGTACDMTEGSKAVSAQYKSYLSIMSSDVCFSACCTKDGACGGQIKATGMAAALLAGECVAKQEAGTPDETNCSTTATANGDGGTVAATNAIAQALQGLFNYKGCCRTDGKCGVDLNTLTLGCMANEDVGKVITLFGNMVPAKTCK